MLVPDRLTVELTVEVFEAPASAPRINSLEGSLMIEWEGVDRLARFRPATSATWRGVSLDPRNTGPDPGP